MSLLHTAEFEEQSSAPSTPATGNWKIYPKSDGLYVMDDAGTEYGPLSGSPSGNSAVLFSQTADATVANTVTQTNLLSTGVGSVTLAADLLTAGTGIRLTASGHVSTTGTPTLDYTIELGNVSLGSSGAVTLGDTISNVGWRLFLDIVCRTTGATGTVVTSGLVRLGDQNIGIVKTTTSTVNTTIALPLELLVTWGTASASNSKTCQTAVIEHLSVTGL